MIRMNFQVEKAVAALAYLFRNSEADLYAAMKMMYLADRAHLERFGRFIAGDAYVAMENGPAPDGAYRMLKAVRGDEPRATGAEAAKAAFQFLGSNKFTVARDPDYDELSRSDVECLDEAIATYKATGWAGLRRAAHDKAWEEVWADRATQADYMPVETIAAMLGQDVLEHVRDPFPGTA
ncbi:Panacea domain-containing protein [Luteibacter sp. CQ10]|uniref:Panacea domain-containing protein n=1 Tax=Luteibacter sp. CQ10 TaxID=2805821 RepID=UPI0034A44406